jgi:hypothetical protein
MTSGPTPAGSPIVIAIRDFLATVMAQAGQGGASETSSG